MCQANQHSQLYVPQYIGATVWIAQHVQLEVDHDLQVDAVVTCYLTAESISKSRVTSRSSCYELYSHKVAMPECRKDHAHIIEQFVGASLI
jgi:hypothetical protein